jgi:hypothetical protein
MQSESSKSIERWQLSYVQMNICHLKTLKEKTPMITKGNHEIDKLLIKAKHLVLPLKSAKCKPLQPHVPCESWTEVHV